MRRPHRSPVVRPSSGLGEQAHHVDVDLIRQTHHRRPDDAIGEVLDLQRELCAGEAKIDAFLQIDDESELALGDILHVGDSARSHRELLRLADADGVTDL